MSLPRKGRKTLALTALAGAAALVLSSCAGGAGDGEDSSDASGDQQSFSIGISQFVQHPALDAATASFKQAFIDAGYVEGETIEFDEQNASGEMPTATTIAQGFANAGHDLVLAVATPSAQAAAQNITDIPLLFTAVTDAEAADLVASNEAPGGNVTGSSDINPVGDQLALITEINPDAKTVGIVYSSGEVNSEIQVELAHEAAPELGLEIKETTITNANELKQATEALGDVDAIYVPGDNLVTSGLGSLIAVAEERGILVVGAEGGQVEGGAVATEGIDYSKLGYQTGEMALRILEDGADPATMPVETLKELEVVVNPGAAERLGYEIPAALLERADRTVE